MPRRPMGATCLTLPSCPPTWARSVVLTSSACRSWVNGSSPVVRCWPAGSSRPTSSPGAHLPKLPPRPHPTRRLPGRPLGHTGRALPQLVAAACQVGGLGSVARQLDGFFVGRAPLLTAAQPAQQVGAGRMVGVIAGQLVLETVDGRQCHLRAVEFGDRDGPVEGDDRG